MKRGGRYTCDGRHYDDDDFEDLAGVDAEYFRECAYCGAEVNLCAGCRSRVFLCPRCFGEIPQFGKKEAHRRGRRREQDRTRKRQVRRRIYRTTKGQLMLWTTDQVFGG